MNPVNALVWITFLVYSVSGYRLVCVYTNWSQYRPDGGKFLPEDVDPSMCTHLIYVYAKIQGNKLAAVEWNDDGTTWKEGMYQRVNALKQYNPDLKTLLGVGGWMMGSKDFSRMASTRRSRRMFAKSAVTFLRERDFDGLTIDWQHPTKRGGRPQDRVNFSLLLQEIRRAFEDESRQTRQPSLLLTAGVSASKYVIDSAYEVKNISRYTDFINVFAYDLHGPWDNFTGHPSPLYAREDELGPMADINVDSSMKYWISYGVDRSKLVLGISTYGRTFTLKEPRYNGYMVPTTGPGNAGEFTREPGMLAFYERCNQYFDAPRVWDKQSRVAYWHSGNQWIAGEDIESVKHKVNWVRHNGIGGVMLSSLDMDDFSGLFCTGDYFPLLETINTQFTVPLPPMHQPFQVQNNVMPRKESTSSATYQANTDTWFDGTQTTTLATIKSDNLHTTTQNTKPMNDANRSMVHIADTQFKPILATPSVSKGTATLERHVDKAKQRNERLISDLLNIFKAQGMMNLGRSQQNLWTTRTQHKTQDFVPDTRIPRPGFQESPILEATTRAQPFTVQPWNTFRRQTQI